MSRKRRIIGSLLAAAVIGALFAGPSSAAVAPDADAGACAASLAAKVDVSQALIDQTCRVWADRHAAGDADTEVPTLAFAWANYGVDSPDAQISTVGWPIRATCLITGAITGPNSAYYVLTGVANTTGPATSTTIQCTASPAGLGFEQTLPGPNSAGADFTTTVLPGSPLRQQKICSYAEAYYLVRPLFMRTNKTPCSPRIAIL